MPTVTCPLTKSAFVRNSAPDTNFGGLNYLDLGIYTNLDFNRIWLQFDTHLVTSANLPAGAVVDSAVIYFTGFVNNWQPPYNNPTWECITTVGGDFNQGTLTWNTQPAEDIYFAGEGSFQLNSFITYSIDVSAAYPIAFNLENTSTFGIYAQGEDGSQPSEMISYVVNDPIGHPSIMPYMVVTYHLPNTGLLIYNSNWM